MNNNRYGRQGGNRRQYSSRQANNLQQNNSRKKKSASSSFIFMTIAVIIIAIVFFSVAIAMLNSANKDKNNSVSSDTSSNSVSQTDTIISFEDDVSSEEPEVYSDAAHPIFQGTWQKTNVYETEKATIIVSRQDNESFDFTFTIFADGKSESISGTASYTGENTAVFTKDPASITFDYGTQYLSVYHTGQNSTLGFSSSVTIDGKFTTGTPNYYKKEETNNYDYNAYKSSAVVKALESTLSADDYSLYTDLMNTGLMSPIPYERTVDKNGKNVNVDAELKCVKYYAVNNNLGINMVMICSNSGKIYVLFYDMYEMRYYTNDKNYSSKMPDSFQTIADSKGMNPIYK